MRDEPNVRAMKPYFGRGEHLFAPPFSAVLILNTEVDSDSLAPCLVLCVSVVGHGFFVDGEGSTVYRAT